MKKNYVAWHVDINDFYKLQTQTEKLKFLIRFGILAPSSHNSQPWDFFVDGEKSRILVRLSEQRKLCVGDPENHLSYISLGCAIGNIEIAANYYGFSTSVIVLNTADNKGDRPDIILEIKEREDHQKQTNNFISNILKRSVNRGPYKKTPITRDFFERAEYFGNDNVKIFAVECEKAKDKLSEICLSSSIKLMENKLFRKELGGYVKHNLTRSFVGIPAFGLNIPTAISFFVPLLVRLFNIDKLSGWQTRKILKQTPAWVVLTSSQNDFRAWIDAGRVYQNIALLAEDYKLKTAIWGAPILDTEACSKIKELLNLSNQPQVVFRVGYPVRNQPHSPRLPVSVVSGG